MITTAVILVGRLAMITTVVSVQPKASRHTACRRLPLTTAVTTAASNC